MNLSRAELIFCRKYQDNRNKRKRELRLVRNEAYANKDVETALAIANNDAVQKKRRIATQGGVTDNPLDLLATNINVVAGCGTDFTKNTSENLIIVCGTACAAGSLAECLKTLHEMNNVVANYSKKVGQDVESLPTLSTWVYFCSPNRKRTRKVMIHKKFSCGDEAAVDLNHERGDQILDFRKAVQAEYPDTKFNLRCDRSTTALISLERTKELMVEHITDDHLLLLFTMILECEEDELTDSVKLQQDALRLGTFYIKCEGSVGAWYLHEVEQIGFPSSKREALEFSRQKFNELMFRAAAKGITSRETCLKFLLASIGFDGSITDKEIILCIDDDAEIVSFFKDIFGMLFPFAPKVYPKPSPLENGKDIVELRVSGKAKVRLMCDAFTEIEEKFLPRKKRFFLEKHALDYHLHAVGRAGSLGTA